MVVVHSARIDEWPVEKLVFLSLSLSYHPGCSRSTATRTGRDLLANQEAQEATVEVAFVRKSLALEIHI